MENNVKIFSNEEFGDIRTIMIDDEPWFVGRDITKALGFVNSRDAIATHVYEEDKGCRKIDTPGGKQNITIVNESGLYALVFGSRLKTAKQFKRWITLDVIPSIRKHGAYMTEQTIEQALTSPDFLIQLATKLKDEQEARKRAEEAKRAAEQTIEEQKPLVQFK